MSEKFDEQVTKPFDAILAEEMSLIVHEECCDCCPHDIGIALAILARDFYDKSDEKELYDE